MAALQPPVEKKFCWICYSAELTPSNSVTSLPPTAVLTDDEWIHPCKCKGSTQWVHQSCLLSWIHVQGKNIYLPAQSTTFTIDSLNSPLGSHVDPSTEQDGHSGVLVLWHRFVTRLSNLTHIFSTRDATCIQISSAICCPQCKTPYIISQSTSNRMLPLLASFFRYQNRLLLIGTLGTFSAAIYLVLWAYGNASLFAMMGQETAVHLCTGGPSFDDIQTQLIPSSESQVPWDVIKRLLRTNFYVLLGIPLFPLVLASVPGLGTSRIAPFALFLYGQVYIPGTVYFNDGRWISLGFLKWLVPSLWLTYLHCMDRLCNHFHVKLDMINPLGDEEDDDSDVDVASIHGSPSVESPIPVATDATDESFPSRQRDNSEEDNVIGTNMIFQMSLSTVVGSLLFPLATGFSSLLLLRLFRPHNFVGPKPLIFHLIGPLLKKVAPGVLSSLYYAIASKLHATPFFILNLISGSTLMCIKDFAQLYFKVQKEAQEKSRKVLNYPLNLSNLSLDVMETLSSSSQSPSESPLASPYISQSVSPTM